MNVLDIDLDFFLREWPRRRESNGRPSACEYQPWSPTEVEDYLLKRCNLKKDSPIPGVVVKHHHELFDHWESLIVSKKLKTPFRLIHMGVTRFPR